MFEIMNNFIILNFDSMLEKFTLPVFSLKQIVFIIFMSFVFLIAFFIILSRDVIYCLLGLIFLYVLCAILVLSYFLEFLAFSLIIVSLGAVAVLFLYVVLIVSSAFTVVIMSPHLFSMCKLLLLCFRTV